MTIIRADLTEIRKWIETIHGTPDGNSDGYININSDAGPGKSSNWEGRTFTSPSDAAHYAASLDGDLGVYMRTTTLVQRPDQGKRGGDVLSRMLPGYAADIDLPSPARKHTKAMPLVPDIESGFLIVEQSGLPQPTLWINSGWGLYPWWIFNQPLDLTDADNMAQAKNISDKFQSTLGRWADRFGWDYGTGVKDMSRVLRIPGTVNRKVEGDHRMCQVMPEVSSYEYYDFDEFASAVLTAYDSAPVPVSFKPPRQAPKVRVEGSALKPGDDFNDRGSWLDILPSHGWTLSRPPSGRTLYWRRPGKDWGTSATTGHDPLADRLYVFSTSTEFEALSPINKHHALAVLEFGGDHGAAARYLRTQGFGGALPEHDRAQNAVSLVRPASSLVGLDHPVDEGKPEQTALAVQANQSLPTLGHDGLPVFTSDVYGTEHWDEMGLVSMYSSTFCRGLRYVHAVDEWMIWDGQRWKRDDLGRPYLASRKLLTALLAHARKLNDSDVEGGKQMLAKAEKLATMTRVNSLVGVAKRDECITASPQDFNQHKNLVTVENGTLNLLTGMLTDFDPDLMLTKKINAVYDPNARGERTTRFLETVQPDPVMRAYMQRLAGYTLLGNADERVLPIVWGKSGSGKSAFLEMLYYTLGNFAAIADPTTLMPQPDNYQGPSEKLHSLMGNRFVKMSELPENAALNQALVKNITGSDTQKTRPLYGHPVEWQVEYTVWMATNNLPRITSTDDAIWKRVKPIHFPNVFVNEDGSVINKDDKDLGRQLARDEASFILNWLLEGIREYLKHGLGEPEAVKDGVGEYRDDMDTTRQFMAQAQENGQIAVEDGASIPARDLYKIYLAWAAESQIKFPVAIGTFKARMLTNGYEQAKTDKANVWKGIRVAGFIGAAQTPGLTRDQWRGRSS